MANVNKRFDTQYKNSHVRPQPLIVCHFGGSDLEQIMRESTAMMSSEMMAYIEIEDVMRQKHSRYVPDHEYMNMSRKGLGVDDFEEIMINMKEDTFIKHLNLNNNISSLQAEKPSRMVQLHKCLRGALKQNKTLTALDLAFNHLFDNYEHPSNEHVHNYMKELTNSLMKSKIKHLDISGNYMCGSGGREYEGILYMMRKYCKEGGLKSLKVRENRLHSQGVAAVSEGLGAFSNLEELDLRDNFIGLDPTGKFNSEGMMLLSRQVSMTKTLQVLKLARNALRDEDLTWLAGAVMYMPRIMELDLSGNQLTGIGMMSMRDAIISHAALEEEDEGLRVLDLSYNPLARSDGIRYLCEGLARTLTIRDLNLRCCEMGPEDMDLVQDTLAGNSTILKTDVRLNLAGEVAEALCFAEVEALNLVFSLRFNHMAFDADKLPLIVYNATAQKLRFLPPNVLQMCYGNPSLVKPFSKMEECLNQYEPPSRRSMLAVVYKKDVGMKERREESAERHRLLRHTHKIFHAVMKWWAVIRKEKQMIKILETQAAKRKMESEKNAESAF